MSAQASGWAWRQELPMSEKMVLLALSDQAGSDGVWLFAPQKDIATMTGTSVRTVRRNLAALEERGLIRRGPQFDGGQRVPDRIELAVEGDLAANVAGGGVDGRAHQSSTTSESESEEEGARPDRPVDTIRADADELLRRKVKVGGRVVTDREMAIAATVISTFNAHSGSDFGLGAHLTPIVGRIRERPSYDAVAHVRLVQSAWRLKWWERHGRGRRPTPAVIYGNANVFEQVVQDAVDEKAGKAPAETPQRKKRYTRED